MRRNKKDEYGFDPSTESTYQKSSEYEYPEEYNGTDNEDALPPDIKERAREYNDGYAAKPDEEKEKSSVIKQSTVKRLMFVIVAASIATLSITLAANNLDPLKSDFLVTGSLIPSSSSSPSSPSTPSSETTAPETTAPETTAPETTTPVETSTETAPVTPVVYTDSFPTLPNLDPDFAGKYAWSGMGTEEYLMIGSDYLHAGTIYTNGGTPISTVSGASYDKSKNTLTLNNFTGGVINVNLMGNGFKIELIGDNAVDGIIAWGAMYGGSVTFTGSGSIKINENLENKTGIMMECEDSQSCIMIDREATVEVFGQYAIVIHRTMLDTAIYALQPVKMTGGTYSTGEFVEYTVNVTDENGIPVKDENGKYITEIITVKDIGKRQGLTLYDYSVVGEDGKPSNHVLFKPEK